MSQYEVFKKVVNETEYKVKKVDGGDYLYLYTNDEYQGRISYLDLFKLE